MTSHFNQPWHYSGRVAERLGQALVDLVENESGEGNRAGERRRNRVEHVDRAVVTFNTALNQNFTILTHTIPDNRTFLVDNVVFFAKPLFGAGLIASGVIEGAVQCFFEIGDVVPVEIRTIRVQTGLPVENRAYFPFLNDRVGAREVTFSLDAKSGRELQAYYINRAVSPVPVGTVGARIEGWLIDSNIYEEILEQQR